VFIQGVSRYLLTSMDDFFKVMQIGDKSRATASTNMNETSSRSHAVMIISISSTSGVSGSGSVKGASDPAKQTIVNQPMVNESTLMLVDLAGSERASATANKGYMRSEEAKSINLSLSALGNCISALCDKKTHIPYRDSKLTRLLQSSLGGSARTAMLITLPPTNTSPASAGSTQYSEVVSALKFAARASKIEVVAKVLRFVDYEKLYQELQMKMDSFQDSEFTYKKELMHKQMRVGSLEIEVSGLK
jgi:kinesin family member 5